MKVQSWIPSLIILSLLAACSAPPPQNAASDAATASPWPQILADGAAMGGEAEFSIAYPGEQGGAVQTFTVASLGRGRYKAWAHSSRRAVREKELSSAQYEELVEELRHLDFVALEREEQGACEKFTLKIQAGGKEGRFEGCRRGGANATLVSRLAHRTEFLLLSTPGR